jgi:hypothetical protein
MSPFRYRDDDSSNTTTILGVLAGAVAGFAVGMYVAQRMGGLDGIKSRLRRRASGSDLESRFTRAHGVEDEGDGFDDIEEDELEPEEVDETMEERVLDAFRNDPVLSGRAIDIGSISEGVIELAGWVETDDESERAVTIARGVPGVTTVVNRIALGDEEERFEDAARRFESDDAPDASARWEGQRVGTGRRRQGNSAEVDRHADPKVHLEERWLREDAALRNAADDIEGTAERRRRGGKQSAHRGDRTGGSPVAPSGVPKADHVAEPLEADRSVARTEAARDTGGASGAQTESSDRF